MLRVGRDEVIAAFSYRGLSEEEEKNLIFEINQVLKKYGADEIQFDYYEI